MKTWVLILILSRGSVAIPGYTSKKACEASAKSIPEVELYTEWRSAEQGMTATVVKDSFYEKFYCIEGPKQPEVDVYLPPAQRVWTCVDPSASQCVDIEYKPEAKP
jgi:hypothetical protein